MKMLLTLATVVVGLVLMPVTSPMIISATDTLNKADEEAARWSLPQFVDRILREFVPPQHSRQLSNLESTAQSIICSSVKNNTTPTNFGLVNNNFGLNDTIITAKCDASRQFQLLMERTFDGAYRWARNQTADKQYREAALDFKAARNWIRGMNDLRFNDEHLRIVNDFYRSYRSQFPHSQHPAKIYAAFTQYVADNSTTAVVRHRVRRDVLSTVSSFAFGALGWIDTGVVLFNRFSMMATPIKVAAGLVFPQLKLVWAAADLAGCVFEHGYELTLAEHSDDRWYNLALCAVEIIGFIPGGNIATLALHSVVSIAEMYFGLKPPPAVLVGLWAGLTGKDEVVEEITSTTTMTTTVSSIDGGYVGISGSINSGISGDINSMASVRNVRFLVLSPKRPVN